MMIITGIEVVQEMETILKEKLMINLDGPLTLKSNLIEDFRLDSIMILELIVELELKYGIEIDDEDLTSSITNNAGELVALIQNKIREK
jgi:acyl carrier protein